MDNGFDLQGSSISAVVCLIVVVVGAILLMINHVIDELLGDEFL